ncbi:NAD(P)-dependent dehydrogenase (short-subunit alcohol dehydrogenase family) [Mycobacterium sp. BK558]|uniref:3-oxoacyl-[acyl-carrier-protein] reductase FabG n=1 Tax=Mycolicibacterium chlorophenolicum TaxID=37916 RepID=A0A0J6W4A1_9MYCO|nr:SDR family NAD(P)-dependent oxidoreductase [Mycolicibacterium chlorophenolicum]KMO78125.1 3-oxoacyl-[acyl-carrier-protein] reductase FabG [Mycolicibacterium chlorophenolicum]MBI5336975.1 SDR family oxidoreductase [Mycolicibacterium rufum]RZT14189.1 NAD(P)-dependent dehydrogenase (short-subunit alcohol dehydrogenase family) [Mycobacterium sp. BK558]
MSRTAVVTGAGSGIGRAIAHALAQRDWRVVVTDLDGDAAESVATALPHQDAGHESAALDVTSADAASAVAADVASRLGLHAWVSNAGISFMHRFLDAPVERYEQTMAVNLKGVFVCGQAAAREMVRTGVAGAIVNTASMAGKQGRVPFLSDYVASKFGVVGLTQAMAYELGEHGITVNCVCPGFVETPMQSRELEWEAELRGTTADGVRDMMIADTPLGRLEQPEDVARAVAFLVSEDARFITGEALAVNGGAYMD